MEFGEEADKNCRCGMHQKIQ